MCYLTHSLKKSHKKFAKRIQSAKTLRMCSLITRRQLFLTLYTNINVLPTTTGNMSSCCEENKQRRVWVGAWHTPRVGWPEAGFPRARTARLARFSFLLRAASPRLASGHLWANGCRWLSKWLPYVLRGSSEQLLNKALRVPFLFYLQFPSNINWLIHTFFPLH